MKAAALFLIVLAAGCGGGGGGATTAAAPVGDPVAGKTLFEQQGCGNCHTFEAAGSTKNQGPNLNEVAGRYEAPFIRQSIVDPMAYIEKGVSGSIGGAKPYRPVMPTYGSEAPTDANRLSDQQLADLVSFIEQGR
jgi:mono/diheme cytochrome c family protein